MRRATLTPHPPKDAVATGLIIDRARIVAEGAPRELRTRLAGSPVLRVALKGSVAARGAVEELPGVVAVEEEDAGAETRLRIECAPGSDLSEEIFGLAVAQGWVLRALVRDIVSMEKSSPD